MSLSTYDRFKNFYVITFSPAFIVKKTDFQPFPIRSVLNRLQYVMPSKALI